MLLLCFSPRLKAYVAGLGPPFSLRAGTPGGRLEGLLLGGRGVSLALSMHLNHQLSKRGSLSPISQMGKLRVYTKSLAELGVETLSA